MEAGFERIDHRFELMQQKFDRMQQTIMVIGGGIIATLNAAILAG